MAPEAPPAAPAPSRTRGGNVFTRKLGPLPTWGWILIVVGLIGIYYVWHRNQQSQTATGTDASQVPQFVNQVYTSGVPPAAPAPAATPTCPKGQAWDPDEGKCVPEHKVKGKKGKPKHKGRDVMIPSQPAAGGNVTGVGVFPQFVPPTGG